MREQSFTALPNPMSQPNTVTYQPTLLKRFMRLWR